MIITRTAVENILNDVLENESPDSNCLAIKIVQRYLDVKFAGKDSITVQEMIDTINKAKPEAFVVMAYKAEEKGIIQILNKKGSMSQWKLIPTGSDLLE